LVKLADTIKNQNMTNFIVPVDFSVDSLKGLDWAILFSQKQPVNIQLVYVLSNSTNFQPSVVDQEHKYAQAEFEKLLKEYQPKLGSGSKMRYIIKKGKIYREVVNQVQSYKNGVVCASTHGASGFEELFIGSNALKIIAATEQPVFTIRKPIPNQIKKIVVPIKLERNTRQKAPIVAELAEVFGAEIHVIAITTSKNKRDMIRLESYAKQVEGYFSARGLNCVSKSIIGESLPVLACNYAEAVNADLITIMSDSVDKWNVFLGSFAQQMVSKSTIPLLNITPKEKNISSGISTFGE
jgi:nucleotide-binding universal stress UspA family protein